jgi:VWFA-related protein
LEAAFLFRFRGALAALLLPLAAYAQDPPSFRVGTELVQVPVTVTDRRGVALQDLKREDFQLFDNGVRTEIQHLWRDSDLPLTVGIIVDISYSEHGSIPEQRQAVTEFLNRIMRPDDRAFLATVATGTTLVTDLTNSVEQLRKGAQRILPEQYLHEAQTEGQPLGEPCPTKMDGPRVVSQCGGSAIWDAVYAAARQKLRMLQGTKALIILSDGQDTGSAHNLDRTLEEVQASSTTVYAIKVGDVRALLTRGLSKLAGETGGEQFRPHGNNCAEIFGRIEGDLRTRYVLGFRPDTSTGREGLHQLRVEISRPGAKVRARAGYYQSAAEK